MALRMVVVLKVLILFFHLDRSNLPLVR